LEILRMGNPNFGTICKLNIGGEPKPWHRQLGIKCQAQGNIVGKKIGICFSRQKKATKNRV
jgi:hypothetical protein